MKTYKTLLWISLITGLTIFFIGVYLQYINKFSDGFIAGRFGVNYGMINGFSGMFLGVFILLLSIWIFKIYKDEKKKFDKME